MRASWLKVPLRRSGSKAAIQRRYVTPGSCCNAADTRLNHAAPAQDQTPQTHLSILAKVGVSNSAPSSLLYTVFYSSNMSNRGRIGIKLQ